MVGGNLSRSLFLNSSPPSDRSAGADPLAGVARLIRRICLLREQGEAAPAAHLEANELANAIRDFRLQHGPAALPGEKLREIFATEEEHVVDAMVLAELLIPQLTRFMPEAVNSRPASLSVEPPQPVPSPRVFTGDSPAIPDLLDAMLEAERRPPSKGRR